jgi:hypothetical protein
MTRCAAACGRDLPDEELIETGGVLVCGPCHESIAKQAERRDSIDDAWRAVEIARGYRVVDLHELSPTDEMPQTLWFAAARRGDEPKPCVLGSTPVEALRRLAAKLADERSGVT